MMIRTTVRLDEDLFKEARKKAIDQRVAFADIVNKALKDYLKEPKKAKTAKFELKVYNMGKVKGKISRADIYEDI